MNKTVIALSLAISLTACGGGGSGQPSEPGKITPPPPVKPEATIDVAFKDAAFDASALASLQYRVSEYSSAFPPQSTDTTKPDNTIFFKEVYRKLAADEVAGIGVLNELENQGLGTDLFEVTSIDYNNAELTQEKERDTHFGARIENGRFLTFLDNTSLFRQPWALPEFPATSEAAKQLAESGREVFHMDLSAMTRAEIIDFMEDKEIDNSETAAINTCSTLDVTRTLQVENNSTEVVMVNGKGIETMKMHVIDRIEGKCRLFDGDEIEFGQFANDNLEGMAIWVHPAIGIVKAVETNASRQQSAVLELTGYTLNNAF